MKHNLLLTAMLTAFATSFAVAGNGILTPSLNLSGGLSIAAYCQGDEDYLVEEISAYHAPATYNMYNSSMTKVHTVTDYVYDISFLNSTGHAYEGEDERFLFSQTLFNDDAEFEYVVEKIRLIDSGYSSYEGTYGFKIMQTNGNCLADITFPDGESFGSLELIQLKDKLYFAASYGSVCHLYEVNREVSSNVLKLVSESKVSAGYPNPVKQGEVYTVARGKYSMKNAVVNVVRLDGSLVQSFSTGDNENVEIETSQMNGGVYVYTVIRGNKVIASGRLVVE